MVSFESCPNFVAIEGWEPNEIAPLELNEIAPPANAKPLEAHTKSNEIGAICSWHCS